ncbi:HypC/HybG/HupF family hydrogenase formation chaperone [Georgenia thermotolerans]|uniref:HypC/HybG/HupF family hydrogenase formation chaperone n=1 Tax=Georgenia thermotolerans TaxID=527326 RepID=A0A7J5UPI4_9MICO|nr:HypC/HybG/HupF family hydrogenase formation chaperone [Georgenia thermotolerans]KAE8764316.1 HypC/HybG/HupF family hydrogenase formation chaperone [Georgenia thermotolerans]
MCLGIPGRIVAAVEGHGGMLALADVRGVRDTINLGMLDGPPPGPGAWVLIHMGFAMEVIDEDRAARAMEGLELLGPGRDADPRGAP